MKDNLAYQEPVWEELIGGRTVAMSPRPTTNHNRTAGNIYRIFGAYLDGHKCEPFPDGVELYLTKEDRFVPDGMVVCDPDKVQPDGVHGVPDLVVEVLSPSTAKYDRGHKKDVYEKCGVQEYWIVDPANRTVEQYLLEEGRLELHTIHALLADWMWEKLNEAERAGVTSEFRCSLFSDLTIRLEDIFRRVL